MYEAQRDAASKADYQENIRAARQTPLPEATRGLLAALRGRDEDTREFHRALEEACAAYRVDAYREFKEWCDRYFYLPHRREPRGVGGIFFDELASGDLAADFRFVKGVGEAFLAVYPRIVERRRRMPYDEAAREQLFRKRGRYVEFNLVYDRGTKFGFATDADPEAYLMSLPPIVKW